MHGPLIASTVVPRAKPLSANVLTAVLPFYKVLPPRASFHP